MMQLATRPSCAGRSTRTAPQRAVIAASDRVSSHLAISRALWFALVAQLAEATDDHAGDHDVTR
jgi:hypothetical protein